MKIKIRRACLLAGSLFLLYGQPILAMTESEAKNQVDAVGKEAVSGNVLVWFLCAIAFLKISQKLDSIMASLGLHVGQTGSNMLAEVMITAKGIGGLRNFAQNYFGGGIVRNKSAGRGGNLTQGLTAMSGGLAGVVSRKVTSEAVHVATEGREKQVSSKAEAAVNGLSKGIGGALYESSVKKGGEFANQIIGTVATGNFNSYGSITGERAEQALSSYLGYTALESGAQDVPIYKNVEIGGGHITGTEISEKYPEGIAFGMYHTGQYIAPQGKFTTVHSIDGAAWYKQYAQDTVDKTPYMAPDGTVAYKEAIIKKLPPAPKRKDKV